MEIYLVGGAVRDVLLGLPVKDRDYVVTGASPAIMLSLGYKQVGADFPVFLHPETGDEYALARTERKSGTGYSGFAMNTTNVTLFDDLYRRDLTINAIAQCEDGTLIDYYGGVSDLKNKVLRHVSPAFMEDPVRVLRVARFMARYRSLGFTIADETLILMNKMVKMNLLSELTPERVWLELSKALMEPAPSVFFDTLREVEALAVVFPEIDALFGVPQNPIHHPEVDCGVHTLLVVDRAVALGGDLSVRVAALLHDLGKAITPADILPQHLLHEHNGIPIVENFCNRLCIPSDIRKLAMSTCEHHLRCHRVMIMTPKKILKLIKSLDGLRRPNIFYGFILACKADAQGRTGKENCDYVPYDFFITLLPKLLEVTAAPHIARGLTGLKIGEGMYRDRLKVIKEHRMFFDKVVNASVL